MKKRMKEKEKPNKKSEKGLSTIVATLLIILLTLVAIGIIWVVVRNVLQGGSEQVSLGKFTLNLEIKSVARNITQNSIEIKIKRNPGYGEFSGIEFIINDEDKSEIVDVLNLSMKELDEKLFNIILNAPMNVSKLQKISIAPIFILESGKQVVGEIEDEYIFSQSTEKDIPPCTDTCLSLGYECGAQIICDVITDCGTCALANAISSCNETAKCVISSCNSDYGDCDLDRLNGCETALGTNSNCAFCGDACEVGYTCNSTKKCDAPCTLTSASWNQTSATEGDPVRLNLVGNNCDGKIISFQIWEMDGPAYPDDPVIQNPSNIIFNAPNPYGIWIAEKQEDTDENQVNPPEHYFLAYGAPGVGGFIASSVNLESLLKVY